jgi:hypothetical protein
MAPHGAKEWLRWAGAALCAALALGPAAPAQTTPAEANVFYSQRTAFLIPFSIDPGENRIRQVLLNVSDDGGKTYRHVATAGPTEKGFRFEAPKDGWYWFTVQTEDSANRRYPPDPGAVAPGLKVCVDTRKPRVTLKPVLPREGTVAVEWDVKDDNLDLSSLRLSYRPAGGKGEWTPLYVQQLANAQFGWTPAVKGPCEVRLEVSDRARNRAEATATVTPNADGSAPERPAGSAKVQYVKSRTFSLTYSIENEGPSKVKHVDVWVTQDSRSWEKLPTQARPEGPHQVTVTKEGRYGFTLIPVSGVGLSEQAPKLGDEPQVWVVVDETKPAVSSLRVEIGRGPDKDKLLIRWSATDKYLAEQPISVKYATSPEGPWTELKTKLDNTGTYTHPTEGLPPEVYVQVEAVDRAGNVGSARTREPVKVDTKVPRVKEVGVAPAEAPAKEP